MNITHPAYKLFTLLIVLGLSSTQIFAAGFRIPEVSIAGLATSNALVANTNELGALPYNPAAMAFHDGYNIVTGMVYLKYDLAVTPTGGSYTKNIGKSSFLIPNVFIANQLNDAWTFGIAINSPFGLETKWPRNTFPGFLGIAGLEVETSKIKMVNVNPNISYKLGDNSALAFGIDYYKIFDLQFNSHAATIQGKGEDFGWNVGYTHKFDNLTFGLSYHSSAEVGVDGYYSVGNAPIVADLELPWTAQIGVHYQATPKLGVEFDIDRTGWSTWDSLVIKFASTGSTLTTSNNYWDNVTAYRLGVIYQMYEKTQLRFGYSIDERAQSDSYFTATVSDSDRQLFSLGVKHDLGEGWEFEASYMYVPFDDRNFNSSTTYIPGAGNEKNGTTVYNGNYEASVNLIGVGLTAKF